MLNSTEDATKERQEPIKIKTSQEDLSRLADIILFKLRRRERDSQNIWKKTGQKTVWDDGRGINGRCLIRGRRHLRTISITPGHIQNWPKKSKKHSKFNEDSC